MFDESKLNAIIGELMEFYWDKNLVFCDVCGGSLMRNYDKFHYRNGKYFCFESCDSSENKFQTA